MLSLPRVSVVAAYLLLSCLPNALGFDFFKKKAAEPAEHDRDTITAVQIYLDSQLLGPGKIDGELGTFTRQAAEDFNLRNGIEVGNWHELLKRTGKAVPSPYQSVTIPESASKFIGSLPSSRAAQAEQDYMPYRSYHEYIAERYHASMGFITRLNPELKLDTLRPGQAVVVPNVTEFRIEAIERNIQFKAETTLSTRRLQVDTRRKTVRIYDGEKLLASFPITPGREKFIPYGEWKCVNMVTTPEFRYDSQMLNAGKRSDEYHMLPPGPNSPVGIFWAGLDKSGIGLHGTNSPETIGRAQSAGCIRLANWDAVRLSALFRPGASVEVR